MNSRLLLSVALVGVSALAIGCGNPGPSPTHSVRIDVGGRVVWSGDADVSLPGVTVTVTNVDGDVETAVTNSEGLWVLSNLEPGAYIEKYEAPGYETVTDTFLLEAGGENDVKNIFVSRGTVGLEETRLFATVAPYNLVLRDGDDVRDGFSGVVATYTSGTDIVVTFNRRTYNSPFSVFLFDDPSGDVVTATLDTATETTYTISAADIAAMDGGAGPATDTDPFTWDLFLVINSVDSWTPIHGDLENLDAVVEMNATP